MGDLTRDETIELDSQWIRALYAEEHRDFLKSEGYDFNKRVYDYDDEDQD